MALILYGDFTSPWCYLASRRVDALAAAGVDIGWRAVEQAPWLPVTGRPLRAEDRAETERQMHRVAALLLPGEELPWTVPARVCRTGAAVSGYAEAYEAGVAADVRRLLYAAYWVDGVDIGNPEILRKLLAGPILRGHSPAWPLREHGFAVSVSGGPMTTAGWRRLWSWRQEWTRLGAGAVPILVADGEPPVTGEEVLRVLEKEMIRTGAQVNPDLPDPARYPATSVRPPMDWVSSVGGSWACTWMPAGLGTPARR